MVDPLAERSAPVPGPGELRGRRHRLLAVVTIAPLGTVCGFDGRAAINDFGRLKRPWLETFLELPKGTPSRDTSGRLFAAFNPEAFERCLRGWTANLARMPGGGLIAIDGKTFRGSGDAHTGKCPLHLASAWCRDNGVALGQLATEAKSNEGPTATSPPPPPSCWSSWT